MSESLINDLKEELALTIEELILVNGDDMGFSRAERVSQLRSNNSPYIGLDASDAAKILRDPYNFSLFCKVLKISTSEKCNELDSALKLMAKNQHDEK